MCARNLFCNENVSYGDRDTVDAHLTGTLCNFNEKWHWHWHWQSGMHTHTHIQFCAAHTVHICRLLAVYTVIVYVRCKTSYTQIIKIISVFSLNIIKFLHKIHLETYTLYTVKAVKSHIYVRSTITMDTSTHTHTQWVYTPAHSCGDDGAEHEWQLEHTLPTTVFATEYKMTIKYKLCLCVCESLN